MPAPKQIVRQRDFSGGELVEYAKRRDDEAVVRSGARDLQNCSILATGTLENRAGRSILFQSEGRIEEVRMSPTATYRLCWGEGSFTIRDSDGAIVARAWGYSWTAATANQVRWDRFDNDIVCCFSGQVPKIARWDGGTEWTFLDFAFDLIGVQKRAPFYRIAPKGITLTPSGTSGSITITFDEDYLVAGMVGNIIRFQDRQMRITAVTNARSGTATVIETLITNRQILTWTFLFGTVSVNDVLQGAISGAVGLVTAVTGSTSVDVTLQSAVRFQAGESALINGAGIALIASVADNTMLGSVVWDEEVINSFRGWPRSVSVDQNRLIFSDLPGVPSMIAWSAIGVSTDHHVGAHAIDAFQELAPRRGRVYHVTGGADEFVFTEDGLYYIPISESSPLVPGSVSFRAIPSVPASAVEPISTPQGLLYVPESLDAVVAVVGTGQAAAPYLARPVSDLHEHLFSGIVGLAVEAATEAHVFAVNSDGSVAVGRYQPGKEWVGWVPWDGDGDVVWVSALGETVLFCTDYGTYTLVEQMFESRYLDASVAVNDIPTALSASAGAALFIPADQGTAIGNMTANGGYAAAFDGITAQTGAACAAIASTTGGTIGKTLGGSFRIAKAEVWPSSDNGFTDQANVTISLRAKQGAAPSNLVTEGTQLATTGSIADTLSMQTLTSSDTTTAWDHAWVLLTILSGGASVAEVKFYSPGDAAKTGSLWFYTGETVDLVNGLRYLGRRVVTAGEIVLQEGDDFSDDDVVAGFKWTALVEPFVGHVQGGQSVGQTVRRRQIAQSAVAVQMATDFAIEQFMHDRSDDPDEGNWHTVRRTAPFRAGENQDGQPPQRECVEEFTPVGSNHDPRIRIVKDTPGTLRVLEIDVQIEA